MKLSSMSRVVLLGIQGLLVLTLWSCSGGSDSGAGKHAKKCATVH